MINAPFLESSEQLDRFFPSSIHEIKFYIFQNIFKCLIHGLIRFKHKNMCDLCDIIPKKDKKGKIMVKKYFVLHEGIIYFFHEKIFIPTTEKLAFHIAHFVILGSMDCGKTKNDCF